MDEVLYQSLQHTTDICLNWNWEKLKAYDRECSPPFLFFFELFSCCMTDRFVFVHNKLNTFKKKDAELWASKWILVLACVN